MMSCPWTPEAGNQARQSEWIQCMAVCSCMLFVLVWVARVVMRVVVGWFVGMLVWWLVEIVWSERPCVVFFAVAVDVVYLRCCMKGF